MVTVRLMKMAGIGEEMSPEQMRQFEQTRDSRPAYLAKELPTMQAAFEKVTSSSPDLANVRFRYSAADCEL